MRIPMRLLKSHGRGVQFLISLPLLGLLLASLAFGPAATGGPSPALQRAPEPPEVSAVALEIQEVYLRWSFPASSIGASGYTIVRNGRTVVTVGSDQVAYLDTGLSPATSYVYLLEAVLPPGSGPVRSRPVQIKTPSVPETPDNTPPSEPEMLDVQPGEGRMVLSWGDSSDDTDISGYVIRRDGDVLTIVNSGTRIYFDYDVQPGQEYEYSVEAVDVVGHHSRPERSPRVPAPGSAPASTGRPGPNQRFMSGADVTASAAALQAGGYTSQLRRYPYLTDLVGPYATVNWATDRSGTTGSVKWGRAGVESCTANTATASPTSITVNGVGEYQWKAELTLAPGTEYCYRVFLGGIDLLGSDPSPHFFTQVPAGANEPFTFAVIGDWGSVDDVGNNAEQANLMAHLAASGARFALTTGDNAYSSGSQTNYGDLVQTGPGISAVFGPQFWTRVGASMALFPAIGNHGFKRSDTEHPHFLNWPQDRAVAGSGGRYQRDTYCCVNGTASEVYPSTWYAFDAGIARFYVLQTAWPSSNEGTATVYENDYSAQWTPSSAQYQWLANDLATHPSALKFAFFHYPMYSDNKHEDSDTYLQGQGSLEGLLKQYGVNMTFDGHAHLYQHNSALQPPIVINYLTGGGGAHLERMDAGCSPYDTYALGWSYSANNGLGKGYACGSAVAPSRISQVFHFMLVAVNGTSVTVSGVNSEGVTFDVQTYDFGGSIPSPTATATPTATPTATSIVTPTATATSIAAPSDTPTPTATSTGTPTATATVTATLAPTDTPTATTVPVETLTATATVSAVDTATPTATSTATPTGTPTPVVTAPRVFEDGFESGDLGAWDSSAGLSVQSAVTHAGTFAAEGNTTTGRTYAKRVLGGTYNEGYVRIYFNILSAASQVNVLRLRTGSDGSIAYLGVTTAGRLQLRSDPGALTITSAASAGPGWHALEFRALVNGAAGATEVWLDGVRLDDLSRTMNLGTTPIGRLQIGEVNSGRTYDVVFDDVVFDTQPIGP